jgi:hypothetical protein
MSKLINKKFIRIARIEALTSYQKILYDLFYKTHNKNKLKQLFWWKNTRPVFYLVIDVIDARGSCKVFNNFASFEEFLTDPMKELNLKR